MIKSPREVLEEALLCDFNDLATHSAYADLLMEKGDLRGEYIQLKLALEDRDLPSKRRREMEQRSIELLHEKERDWLGDLANFILPQKKSSPDPVAPNIEHIWKRGWLAELYVQDVRQAFTQVLAEAPEIRLLQKLVLCNTRLRNNDRVFAPLLESPYLTSVRFFQLGDDENSLAITADGNDVVPLIQKMPYLEDLILRADQVDTQELFQLPLPHLRRLHLEHITGYPIGLLGKNSSLTRLQYLHLIPAMGYPVLDPETGQPVVPDMLMLSPKEINTFFCSPYLNELSHLTLRIPSFGDFGCEELVRSGRMKQLKHLDLRNCSITDAGAEQLANDPTIRNVKFLDIGGNRLSSIGIDALLETDIRVQYDSQFLDYQGGEVDAEPY